MTTAVVRPVGSVDDLFRLDPLDRFRALIAGGNFPAWLRAEPLTFDRDDPIFGYGCGIEGCGEHSTQAGLWCTQHARDRLSAQQRGIGEAAWKAAAVPFPTRPIDVGGSRGSACRFCPERDAVGDGLCLRHRATWTRARKIAGDGFDETRWAARQHALPGSGPCLVPVCPGNAELSPALCPRHRLAWRHAGRPTGTDLARWLPDGENRYPRNDLTGRSATVVGRGDPVRPVGSRRGRRTGQVAPDVAAHPGPILSRRRGRITDGPRRGGSDLDTAAGFGEPDPEGHAGRCRGHPPNPPGHPGSGVRRHQLLGVPFPGPAVGVRPDRDLPAVAAGHHLGSPGRCARRPGPSPHRRPHRAGPSLTGLPERLPARVRPVRGRPAGRVDRVDGQGIRRRLHQQGDRPATGAGRGQPGRVDLAGHTDQLLPDHERRPPGAALGPGVRCGGDSAAAAGVRRRDPVRPFAVVEEPSAVQRPGAGHVERPGEHRVARRVGPARRRPGRHLVDPGALRATDRRGRQAALRLCERASGPDLDVGGHDQGRQTGLRHPDPPRHLRPHPHPAGQDPAAVPRQVRCRPHPAAATGDCAVPQPGVEPDHGTVDLAVPVRRGVQGMALLRRHRTARAHHHQARHTLATRLVEAGASMAHVKKVLGQVSERMAESYVLIGGSQVEPFLQQVWVNGPGSPTPGQVVLTPNDQERSTAARLMVDLAVIPTEHGLCTFTPVVGGHDCPFNRQCHSCEHFVITGADYSYWKRQQERWAAMAEGAPDQATRDYIYRAFEKSSTALAGLEKALLALGLLDQAGDVDLRNPHQDFFDPIWRTGWRAGDLIQIGTGSAAAGSPDEATEASRPDQAGVAS